MLIEFTVGNFRSVREIQKFSMVATSYRSKHPEVDTDNTYDVDEGLRLLRSSAVYGANASGKSNIVLAMMRMRQFIEESAANLRFDAPVPVDAFAFDPLAHDTPSFFEVIFLLNGKQFRYGFEATRNEVVSEWLYNVPSIREAKLFYRKHDSIQVASKFAGKRLVNQTRKNALFLSVVAQFNGKIAQEVIGWFKNFNIVMGRNDVATLGYTINQLKNNTNYASLIRELVRRLDVGISDIEVIEQPISKDSLPDDMPDSIKEELLSKFESHSTVKTYHKGISNEIGKQLMIKLDLDSESQGTQKLFALAGPLIDTITQGKVLVIDEMDARLHPLITREIIKLFNSKKTNALNAQLVFTTHDTNLLNQDIFRRDQIWFVEKDQVGATHLFSLIEYKPRNDASLEKEYIQGRYGAIPFFGDLGALFEDFDGQK